jgi:hypothetical protein
LKQTIAEAPEETQQAYEALLLETQEIATQRDLDVLLAKLKGDKQDELL